MAFELCRASSLERRQRLPGDECLAQPGGVITHAITIDAPAESVWPWLIQMGSGRAGWYSFDHIDNGGRPSARRIMPDLQRVGAGDVMPWLPGAQDGFLVTQVLPETALVLGVPVEPAAARTASAPGSTAPALRASWALIVEPVGQGRVRLLSRSRFSRDWLAPADAAPAAGDGPFFIERVYSLLAKLPWPLLLPVAGSGHYFMESRMLRGVKRRVERRCAEPRRRGAR